MNFDPYDSVAWRSFGMLDAEERALFEEAMLHDPDLRRACHEMDRLAAAIAATAVAPVQPEAGETDRLRRSLGLPHAGRKAPLWLTLTGWAAALVLAALMARSTWFVQRSSPPAAAPPNTTPATAPSMAQETAQPQEIRRLLQEIDDLRKTLEEFHQRDRSMFQVLPGRALQTVMIMIPPGSDPADAGALATLATPAMLGDALAAINNRAAELAHQEPMMAATEDTSFHGVENAGETEIDILTEEPQPAGPPVAIPIYDAARDAGTLVVSNLPPAAAGKAYHLWVTTGAGARPVFLGMLPEPSATGAEAFDFSLGSSMILPVGFLLTMDPPGSPAAPSEANTVLLGPPGLK